MTANVDGNEYIVVYGLIGGAGGRAVPLDVDSAGRLVLAAGGTAQPGDTRLQDGAGTTLASILAGLVTGTGAPAGLNPLLAQALSTLFDGTNLRTQQSASAANLAAQSAVGAALIAPPGNWAVASTPAAGSQASASKAAGAAGVRHVITSAYGSFGAVAAPAATTTQFNVRDGASGAGTVLDAKTSAVPAAVFATDDLDFPVLNDIGSAATAATAEFAAAVASVSQGASLNGYDAA